jgi:coenzyme F420-reducing hydrogenase delta subunit/ferredoxin
MQYAPNVRVVKVPCSGRIDPLFLIKAFEQGADGVLVSGCHPGDCHYVSGNLLAQRRFTAFRELLSFLGLETERLQFSWVSAAEAVKWTEVVDAVTEELRELGPRSELWGEVGSDDGMGATLSELIGGRKTPVLEPDSVLDVQRALRREARRLLEDGEVGAIVGFGLGTLEGTSTPVFISEPDQVSRLIWDQTCVNNLAVYLTRAQIRRLGRVGLVAKGCDAKAALALLQEHQIDREDVAIIGMPCRGVVENGELAAKCLACDVHTPTIYDHLVPAPEPSPVPDTRDPRAQQIAALNALTPAERRAYWNEQFSRCIRCYACRAVCPLCYCDTCIVERTRPQWIAPEFEGKGNLSWNITRAMHLAGRCVLCDECARACPASIRLDLINLMLAGLVRDQYGYRPGYDVEAIPPLTTFRPDEQAEFIR